MRFKLAVSIALVPRSKPADIPNTDAVQSYPSIIKCVGIMLPLSDI